MKIVPHHMFTTVNKLTSNQKKIQGQLEKVASGLRINRAADDASSLAISEKLRAQIRGLVQAKRNVTDGISLVNVAEGALAAIHDPPLQRMRELAIQAANDTLTEADRNLIQLEVEQLKRNINHIANNTEFNTIKLLAPDKTKIVNAVIGGGVSEVDIVFVVDNSGSMAPIQTNVANNIANFASELGNYGVTDFRLGVMEYTNNEYNISTFSGGIWTTDQAEMRNEIINLAANNRGGIENVLTAVDIAMGTYDFRVSSTGAQSKHIIIITNEDSDDEALFDGTMASLISSEIRVHAVYNPLGENGSNPRDEIGQMASQTGGSYVNINFQDWGALLVDRIAANIGSSSYTVTEEDRYDELILHVGSETEQTLSVELFDARTTNLGISDIDILHPQHMAEEAILKIDEAIQLVSEQRAKFGTYANRLEHIHSNLSVGEVNVSQSESHIRDMDIAVGMMNLTKHNILNQATQAMVAQANVMAQQSLQLLRSG